MVALLVRFEMLVRFLMACDVADGHSKKKKRIAAIHIKIEENLKKKKKRSENPKIDLEAVHDHSKDD